MAAGRWIGLSLSVWGSWVWAGHIVKRRTPKVVHEWVERKLGHRVDSGDVKLIPLPDGRALVTYRHNGTWIIQKAGYPTGLGGAVTIKRLDEATLDEPSNAAQASVMQGSVVPHADGTIAQPLPSKPAKPSKIVQAWTHNLPIKLEQRTGRKVSLLQLSNGTAYVTYKRADAWVIEKVGYTGNLDGTVEIHQIAEAKVDELSEAARKSLMYGTLVPHVDATVEKPKPIRIPRPKVDKEPKTRKTAKTPKIRKPSSQTHYGPVSSLSLVLTEAERDELERWKTLGGAGSAKVARVLERVQQWSLDKKISLSALRDELGVSERWMTDTLELWRSKRKELARRLHIYSEVQRRRLDEAIDQAKREGARKWLGRLELVKRAEGLARQELATLAASAGISFDLAKDLRELFVSKGVEALKVQEPIQVTADAPAGRVTALEKEIVERYRERQLEHPGESLKDFLTREKINRNTFYKAMKRYHAPPPKERLLKKTGIISGLEFQWRDPAQQQEVMRWLEMGPKARSAARLLLTVAEWTRQGKRIGIGLIDAFLGQASGQVKARMKPFVEDFDGERARLGIYTDAQRRALAEAKQLARDMRDTRWLERLEAVEKAEGHNRYELDALTATSGVPAATLYTWQSLFKNGGPEALRRRQRKGGAPAYGATVSAIGG